MKTVQMFTKINLKNGFRGAQLKTWDFYHHIKSHPDFEPYISFHSESQWSADIPWTKQQVRNEQKILENPDYYLFKGGNDWRLFLEQHTMTKSAQIISPIVNFRVLNSDHYSHELLKIPAIRVCPSPALTHRLIATGKVNGPVHFIANGIDTTKAKSIAWKDKQTELLIVAFKNPEFGDKLATQIKNSKHIKLLKDLMPFSAFIDEMSQAKYIIHCPHSAEAHYLPGLEGMLQGAINILPDCIGNTFYVEDGKDAFICQYELKDVIRTFEKVYNSPSKQQRNIASRAIDKAHYYSLVNERNEWHQLLNQLK